MGNQKISDKTIGLVNKTFKEMPKDIIMPVFPSFDYKLQYLINKLKK